MESNSTFLCCRRRASVFSDGKSASLPLEELAFRRTLQSAFSTQCHSPTGSLVARAGGSEAVLVVPRHLIPASFRPVTRAFVKKRASTHDLCIHPVSGVFEVSSRSLIAESVAQRLFAADPGRRSFFLTGSNASNWRSFCSLFCTQVRDIIAVVGSHGCTHVLLADLSTQQTTAITHAGFGFSVLATSSCSSVVQSGA